MNFVFVFSFFRLHYCSVNWKEEVEFITYGQVIFKTPAPRAPSSPPPQESQSPVASICRETLVEQKRPFILDVK